MYLVGFKEISWNLRSIYGCPRISTWKGLAVNMDISLRGRDHVGLQPLFFHSGSLLSLPTFALVGVALCPGGRNIVAQEKLGPSKMAIGDVIFLIEKLETRGVLFIQETLKSFSRNSRTAEKQLTESLGGEEGNQHVKGRASWSIGTSSTLDICEDWSSWMSMSHQRWETAVVKVGGKSKISWEDERIWYIFSKVKSRQVTFNAVWPDETAGFGNVGTVAAHFFDGNVGTVAAHFFEIKVDSYLGFNLGNVGDLKLHSFGKSELPSTFLGTAGTKSEVLHHNPPSNQKLPHSVDTQNILVNSRTNSLSESSLKGAAHGTTESDVTQPRVRDIPAQEDIATGWSLFANPPVVFRRKKLSKKNGQRESGQTLDQQVILTQGIEEGIQSCSGQKDQIEKEVQKDLRLQKVQNSLGILDEKL